MSLRTELRNKLVEFLNNEVFPRLREQMREGKHDINASSNLMQSIQIRNASVDVSGAVSAQIEGDFYWKFLEYGVDGIEEKHNAPFAYTVFKPSRNFHENILDWIPHTGHRKPEEFKSYEDYAWAIMINIFKRGKAPRPFVQDALDNIDFDKFEEEIFKIIGNYGD